MMVGFFRRSPDFAHHFGGFLKYRCIYIYIHIYIYIWRFPIRHGGTSSDPFFKRWEKIHEILPILCYRLGITHHANAHILMLYACHCVSLSPLGLPGLAKCLEILSNGTLISNNSKTQSPCNRNRKKMEVPIPYI